jgi:hypothetical protein
LIFVLLSFQVCPSSRYHLARTRIRGPEPAQRAGCSGAARPNARGKGERSRPPRPGQSKLSRRAPSASQPADLASSSLLTQTDQRSLANRIEQEKREEKEEKKKDAEPLPMPVSTEVESSRPNRTDELTSPRPFPLFLRLRPPRLTETSPREVPRLTRSSERRRRLSSPERVRLKALAVLS